MTLADRVAGALADDGPVAAAFDGFEPRAGQRQLAVAVANTFDHGGALLAEAGTGTGKTLAYLLPAVLSGRRVLISTGTRPLQDQIFYKDIPGLAAALGKPVRAAYMKGRTNYLCLHRFERLREAEAGLAGDDRRWLDRIAAWVPDTGTGDRAEIEDLPDALPLWAELSATSEQCLGRECPRYAECFVTRMREAAADAQLVIVNHHLLCADASVRQGGFGEVIPECDLAVIDEAHQLEDVVTQYFGVAVGTHRVDEFVREAVQAAAACPPDQGRFAASVVLAVHDVRDACRRLFDTARLDRSDAATDRVTLDADRIARLHDVGLAARDALDRLAARIRSQADLPEDLAAIGARAAALRDDAAIVLADEDPAFVRFVELRGRGVTLRAAPIEVARLVRDAIVGGRRGIVFTSATLAVEGAFDYARSRLGLEDAAALQVPSEFDYRTQAILYLPPEMPDPRSDDFNPAAARVIGEILDRTRGRAFVLFTSYAAMRAVRDRLGRRTSWPLLVQGDAPRSALLREFRATPNAVLLATASFWQGIDVAGEALSCVIVDRLPFASPVDPLVAARMAAIERRGGQPFHDYQVPLAILTLLQGLGRLIRTRSDRGVLAILDPRLLRRAYGRRFLASLPPAPVTDDLEALERFLAVDGTAAPIREYPV